MLTKAYPSPLIWLLCFVLLSFNALAETKALHQAKVQLREIDGKIQKLQQTVKASQNKRKTLYEELKQIEKDISLTLKHVRSLTLSIQHKQQAIATKEQAIETLTTQLQQQQKQFAADLQTRYQMQPFEALKWLLNHHDHTSVSRQLSYYQYMIQKRQNTIHHIQHTQQQLAKAQQQFTQDLASETKLKQSLEHKQQTLFAQKLYHHSIIEALNQHISSSEQTLRDFQHNKHNLAQLLIKLSRRSPPPMVRPFQQLRHKLPKPVPATGKYMQTMNQGVTFFADEGTPVQAIYPGKVVFSDWLKGYGLLLIIDHGQGFMSLYAHNQSLYKAKGSKVMQNEIIASVGHSGGIKQNGLYFEVRQGGKAVSPLDWVA